MVFIETDISNIQLSNDSVKCHFEMTSTLSCLWFDSFSASKSDYHVNLQKYSKFICLQTEMAHLKTYRIRI